MSRVLILNKSMARRTVSRSQRSFAYKRGAFCSIKNSLSVNKESFSSGSVQINLVSVTFALLIIIIICGASYLYQVNSIATKGFEVRDLESKIQTLNKENRKMEIQEVELRSMYNIEKSSQELNLVNSKEVTYIEINGPVAMK